MVVLSDPKLIFIKPHKVGGTSFEIALSKYAKKDSIITPIGKTDEAVRKALGYRGPQNYKYPIHELMTLPAKRIAKNLLSGFWPEKYISHLTAREIYNLLPRSTWEDHLKISIVRNPFDIAVSAYFWLNQDPKDRPDFGSWCLEHVEQLLVNRKSYYIDKKEVVDFYLVYHRLEEDLLELESKMPTLAELWNAFCSISTKGGTRPAHASIEYMFANAQKARTLIVSLFDEEIERFGFKTP